MTDRARMAAAGLVPVTFEAPPPDHGCAGTWRPFKSCFVALCHTCQRFGKGGPQIDPAARIVHAGARCLNYVDAGECHVVNVAAPVNPVSPPALGGCCVRRHTDGGAA